MQHPSMGACGRRRAQAPGRQRLRASRLAFMAGSGAPLQASVRLPVLGLGLLALLGYAAPSQAQVETIVYARCKRTEQSFDLTAEVSVNGVRQTVTRTMTGLDIYDFLPEVSHFFSGFAAPCDLVLRRPNGHETVIHDCSSTSSSESSCAALDPAVSLDGGKIAYAVFRGTLEHHSEQINARVVHPDADNEILARVDLPPLRLSATGAHLHLYDLADGQTTVFPFVDGVWDSGPAFIDDFRLAFTSTRDGNTSTLVPGTTSSGLGTRIWTIDLDGRNPELASHHSLSQEQHPILLRDGRLAYSSWQIFGTLGFRHTNGSPGGFTTLGNLFHVYAQNPDGAHNFPIYGQHSGDHSPSYFGEDHNAAHFLAQTSDQRLWVADYYRANNFGLGSMVGIMPEPEGQEGVSPDAASHLADIFVPRDVIKFSTWGHNGDSMSKVLLDPPVVHPAYADPLPFAGKVGHPGALPGNRLMLTWGKGACSQLASFLVFDALGRERPPLTSGMGQGVAMNVITSLNLDTPGCDAGIYLASQIPSTHPNDLMEIVDSRQWHEIMPRAVVPYHQLHAVERPRSIARADRRSAHRQLAPGVPFGLLGAASITDRETHPRGGITFQGEKQFNLQGTDTIDYTDAELCGVRILGVMPNRNRLVHREIANVTGERVLILGEFPARNFHADGSPVVDPSGHPDTSFLVRMPANVPYMMQGIDCQGRTLNTDQTWQHLRPGEQKTCGGCHVHSRPSRIGFGQSFAATDGYAIPRLGEGEVPLLVGGTAAAVNVRRETGYGLQVEFTRDIKPIFDRHCIACHAGSAASAGLDLSRTGGPNDELGTTWHCLVRDRSQSCVPPALRVDTGAGSSRTTFRRPQLTRYVRALNSRASLLYWKAANQRTDRRTDAQDPLDIDFGADHPSSISNEELGLLSRWIDIGIAGGSSELADTQKPTLVLTAAGSPLSRLRLGSVDLGRGIDPTSLHVCVVQADGACVNLASAAAMHGVVEIDLGEVIHDPNALLRASISDLAGNQTVVEHTVAWLLAPGGGQLFANGFEGSAAR